MGTLYIKRWLVTLVLSINCALAYSQTTLWSSGFEGGDAAFTGSSTTGTITQPNANNARTGSNSGKILEASNNYDGSIISAALTFTAGKYYKVEVYAKVASCTGTLKIAKSTTATNASMNSASGDDIIMSGSSVSSTSYALFTGYFTVPTTVNNWYIGFMMDLSSCNNGAMYIDDIVVTESNTPQYTYCTSTHSVACTGTTYIDDVSFNSLSNQNTGCTGVDATAYTNYAASGSNTTSVTADSTYTLSVTHKGGSSIASVWIDYNQNGTFDTGEWTQVNTTSTNDVANTVNLAMPSTLRSGTTRMRLRSRAAGNTNSSSSSCTSFASGESEDYTITTCPNTTRTISSDDGDNSIACSEDIQLTLSAGSGTLTIWQSSSNNTTWSNIGGATSSPWTSGALTSTTYYRAKITDGSCVIYTASIQISVVPTAGTASVPTPTTICYNSSKVLSLAGYAGSIQWQESDDNGGADPWGNAVGGTGPTTAAYTTASLASTKYFRAKVTGAGCSDVYSNTLTLTVGADGLAVWTNGSSTTDWGTAGNWCGTVPNTNTTDVLIPSGISQYPTLSGTSRTIRDLTIASGASLTITSDPGPPTTVNFSIYGNIDVSGTLTHNGTAYCELYGASKTIKGTITGDNGGGFDINSGASYTLNGNFTIGQFQVSSSGTISLSSYTLTVDDVTTASFNLAAGGTLNQNTGILQIEESTPTFSGTFNSNTGTTYYNVDASAIFPNSMTYYNLKIATYSGRIHHASSGTSLTIGNNFELVAGSSGGECHHHSTTLVVPGNVTIASGSTLDLNVSDGKSLDIGGNITNSGTISCFTSSAINVFGNFTNNGTFTQNTSTVTMDGTGAQTIGGTTNTTFYNLVIDKSAGTASLGVNKTVSQTLTLTTGRLDLGGYTLTVSRSSAAAIGRTSGYIYSENTSNASKLKWNLGSTAGTYVFPFGIGTAADEYIPFTMELTAGTIGNVTLSTYATGAALTPFPSTPTAVTNITSGGSSNQANMVRRYWQIDKDGASGTTNITFKYADAEVPTNGEGTDIFAQRWNGGSTWDVGIGTHTAGSNQVQATGVTTFSPWALVKSANPLPITLINFDAIINNQDVDLVWSTSSEINNDFFTIEKSMDGVAFEYVTEVKGAGNSNQVLNYASTDKSPYSGKSYYRLKQTDYDGAYSYSEIVSVNFTKSGAFDFTVFPNPVGNYQSIKLKLNGEGNETVSIKIQDLLGKLYFEQKYQMENEEQIINIASNISLSQGVYMVTCIVNDQVYSKKVLVK